MSQTYRPIPDFTPGLRKGEMEQELFQWLQDHCEWREGAWGETKPIYEGFAIWEKNKHGMPIAARSVEQSLTGLGLIVQGSRVLGVFLRGQDATVPMAAHQHNEGARVAPTSASLIEANTGPLTPQPKIIEKDDTDIEAYRKMQFNAELLKK